MEPTSADTPASTGAPNLRQRARARARADILEAAFELFAERGYEGATVQDIAERAGMSTRTVFRYFRAKDDIVVAEWDDFGDRLVAAFQSQPSTEPLDVVLRRTFDLMVRYLDDPEARERADVFRRVAEETPAVGAGMLHRQAAWQRQLTEAARERYPSWSDPADPRLDAYVGCYFASLQAAERSWRALDGQASFADLLDSTLTLLVLPGSPTS